MKQRKITTEEFLIQSNMRNLNLERSVLIVLLKTDLINLKKKILVILRVSEECGQEKQLMKTQDFECCRGEYGDLLTFYNLIQLLISARPIFGLLFNRKFMQKCSFLRQLCDLVCSSQIPYTLNYQMHTIWASLMAQWYRLHLPMQQTQETRVLFLGGDIPWRRD